MDINDLADLADHLEAVADALSVLEATGYDLGLDWEGSCKPFMLEPVTLAVHLRMWAEVAREADLMAYAEFQMLNPALVERLRQLRQQGRNA